MRFTPGCSDDGCCGDEDECIFAQDDFNRADGTDINTGSSCGWTESAGSWSISSNALVTSSANAKAKCGVGGLYAYGKAVVQASASGDAVRILLGGNSGLSSYIAVELEFGTPGKLRILDATNVHRECDVTAPINTPFELKLCRASFLNAADTGTMDGYGLTAWFDGQMVLSAADDTGTYAGTVGLGTGALTGTATFDDVVFGTTYPDDSDCPNCVGECCWPVGETLPDQLKLTISGLADDLGSGCNIPGQCASWDGSYYLDRQDNADCYSLFSENNCACYKVSVSLPCGGSSGFDEIWFHVTNPSNPQCMLLLDLYDTGTSNLSRYYHRFAVAGGPNPGSPVGGEAGAVVSLTKLTLGGGSSYCDLSGLTMTIEAV